MTIKIQEAYKAPNRQKQKWNYPQHKIYITKNDMKNCKDKD